MRLCWTWMRNVDAIVTVGLDEWMKMRHESRAGMENGSRYCS